MIRLKTKNRKKRCFKKIKISPIEMHFQDSTLKKAMKVKLKDQMRSWAQYCQSKSFLFIQKCIWMSTPCPAWKFKSSSATFFKSSINFDARSFLRSFHLSHTVIADFVRPIVIHIGQVHFISRCTASLEVILFSHFLIHKLTQ